VKYSNIHDNGMENLNAWHISSLDDFNISLVRFKLVAKSFVKSE
jgi:hypothetical protein